MGVTQLWQILAPVEQHLALTSLEGQTLAVDLSIWICENQCVKQMQGVVTKPYLRNLFFRISHLTQLGVKLVFVIEGSAPELKWDTMIKRQQSRFPGRQGKPPQQRPAGKQTRRNFNAWLKECCELLEILGIPYIQSKGEAEALCALLNAAGLVDGCLTNDGDAFLYGATTVYRNFTMNTKDPHVEMYRLSDITAKLGIDRGGLVALGLLIGCDFVPKGVPGIGIANAVRLLQSLQGQDVLIRLQSWSTMSERDCVDQAEALARRKAIQVPDFPPIKVIDEFLVAKDRCPSRLPQWKRPVPVKLQEFALIKLEWPIEYTMEKVLPLISLWDMQDVIHSKNPSVHQHLKPHRIVKSRVRQGEPCFEVEWIKPVTDTVHDGSYYVTIEAQDLFTKCYPEVALSFITQTAEQKKKPKAKKKKKKKEDTQATAPPSLDKLSFQFEKVNLGQVTSKLQASAKVLHPSFTEYDETALTTKAKQPRHLTLSPNAKKSNNKGESSESRKPAFPSSASTETVSKPLKDTEEEAFVPLSQRVKLRMQSKHGSTNKENQDKGGLSNQKISGLKSPGADLSNMSSLLEDIQNLSIKEQENFRHKMKEKQALTSKFLCNSSAHTISSKYTPSSVSRKFSSVKDIQKMSSPTAETSCSPMTYMKHQGELGDSFEIQRSPYYIVNPWAVSKAKSEKFLTDIKSPGFFTRPDAKKNSEKVDNRSAAEKLVEKLESGINQTGSGGSIHVDHISSAGKMASKSISNSDENLTVDSLMSILHSSEKPPGTPSNHLFNPNISTPGNQSVVGLDSTSLSQFGDFQIQHSLLNSLCSSLVQALTPKGVTMTKEDYEKLVTTLNELESEDEEIDENDINGTPVPDDVACNVDFSELEKASSSFKNLNQKLLLRPIQIDDEDVMSKLSKSARKKLRRRERKREQELQSLVHLQKNSHSKGKTNSSVEKQPSKSNAVKLKNQEKRTRNEDPSKTNRKLDKSMSRNEKGFCTSSGKKSAEKVKSDLQFSAKSDVNKAENIPHKAIQKHDRQDEANVIENRHEVEEKKKKKRKKKKVKQASPVIDISADESILDDKKLESCAEYLMKALKNNQRNILENKIIKASPFMDFSADDTLLELEELSCKIACEEVDSEVHAKLRQKKRLSKEKKNKESSQTNTLSVVPVLSINCLLSNDSDKNKSEKSQDYNCGKQDILEDSETYVYDEVLERNNNNHISGNMSDESKFPENDKEATLRASCHDSVGELYENLTKQNSDEFITLLEKTKDLQDENESNNAAEQKIECSEDCFGNGNETYADDLVRVNKITNHESENGYGNNIYTTDYNNENIAENCENENYAADCKSENKTEAYEVTNEFRIVMCAAELQNGMKIEHHKNANGGETCSFEFENGDIVKDLRNANKYQNEICTAKVRSGDKISYDRSVDEIVDGLCYSGIWNEDQRSNCDLPDSKDQCYSKRILSKCSKKENFHIGLGCNEENKDIISFSNRNDKVLVREIKDCVVETDSDARNVGDSNCHKTTYHTQPNNVIHRGVEIHVPDENTSSVFNEKFVQVSHDVLVLKSENYSDGSIEEGKETKREDIGIGIPGDAERVFEVRSINGPNADLCLSDERNGATSCNVTTDISCGKHEVKSKHEINGKNIDRGVSVALSSSEDEIEGNTMMRNGLHKQTDENETELCIGKAKGDNETELCIGKAKGDKNNLKNDITMSEVFQSPACLADRLKLKLRKTSTRNVLDVFTNGN